MSPSVIGRTIRIQLLEGLSPSRVVFHVIVSYEFEAARVAGHAGWVAHRNAAGRNRTHHHRAGTDDGIVAYRDPAQHEGVGSDVYPVTQHGHAAEFAATALPNRDPL